MPPSDVGLGGGSSWSRAFASSASESSLLHSALYCLTWRTPSGCSTAPVVGCLCGHGLHGSCAVKPQALRFVRWPGIFHSRWLTFAISVLLLPWFQGSLLASAQCRDCRRLCEKTGP